MHSRSALRAGTFGRRRASRLETASFPPDDNVEFDRVSGKTHLDNRYFRWAALSKCAEAAKTFQSPEPSLTNKHQRK